MYRFLGWAAGEANCRKSVSRQEEGRPIAVHRNREASERDGLSSEEARKLIVAGEAPEGIHVPGRLNLEGCGQIERLPQGLSVDILDVRGCRQLQSLPPGLHAIRVDATGCAALAELPAGLHVNELILDGAAVASLPVDLKVDYRLDLSNCRKLGSLPSGLKVGSLLLRNCTALGSLPPRLEACFLDLAGCAQITDWPEDIRVTAGGLCLRGCTGLRSLPRRLGRLAQLDLRDCANISDLPSGLEVTSWIDVANTGLRELPETLHDVQVRWGGVRIDRRIAFHPELLAAEEILGESNVERRRVMLARFGFEKFLDAVSAAVIDEDRDPGGPRRLVRVALPDDEPLVCLSVHCPSTRRHYLIRVPPDTKDCRSAAAWIAGFDDPDEYSPLLET